MKKHMKKNKLKLILFAVMIIVCVVYVFNKFVLMQSLDNSAPEITFGQDVLEVSVAVTEEELLADASAADKKDGDVSNTVIIESMSKLLENNERIVTYAAFDGDNNVGKAERRIRYTDYTSPKFSMEEPLKASSLTIDLSELLNPLRVTDCIDGDLTSQMIISNTNIQGMSSEGFSATYEVQVTNSCGDVASLVLPVEIKLNEKTNVSGGYAQLELSEYLVYVKKDGSIDYQKYVESAMVNGEVCTSEYISIESDVDYSKPGTYVATYTLEKDEAVTTVDLIIVVEE